MIREAARDQTAHTHPVTDSQPQAGMTVMMGDGKSLGRRKTHLAVECSRVDDNLCPGQLGYGDLLMPVHDEVGLGHFAPRGKVEPGFRQNDLRVGEREAEEERGKKREGERRRGEERGETERDCEREG